MSDAKKILILEDEEILSKTLAERFTNDGYQVFVARDGEAGLNMALENKPDIILSDIIMPKLDGTEVMKRLREANDWGKRVPIILLTNLNTDDDIINSITRDKPAYYLVKTDWSMDQIAQKVKERLSSAENEMGSVA